jgi:protein SCO1
VNRVLDQLEIARVREEKTGRIDHSNIFFLIDRRGKIAYRLGLGDRHEAWLVEGLESLLGEG